MIGYEVNALLLTQLWLVAQKFTTQSFTLVIMSILEETTTTITFIFTRLALEVHRSYFYGSIV